MVQKNAGWVHAEAHVGTYASTYGVEYYFLDKKPTMKQFRRDNYQALHGVNEIKDCEKLAWLTSQSRQIAHRDIPYKEYADDFNMERIVKTEQRISKPGWFFGDQQMFVSDAINCIGRIDSVVVFSDEHIKRYEVMRNGTLVLRLRQTGAYLSHALPPALIMFNGDRAEYVELTCHSSEKPEWLQVECSGTVVYV